YNQALRAADDQRKQAALRYLENAGQQLGLMMNSRKILNNAWSDVRKRASKVAPPIDEEATALRDDIAFQMKQGQGPAVIPEEKQNFGIMSDKEFQDFTRRKYGF